MLGTFYILWSQTGKSNNWAGVQGEKVKKKDQKMKI